MKPLIEEFNWTRAQISFAQGVGRFEGGLGGPFSGWLIDRFGPRIMSLLGISFFGVGLVLMYFINSLWSFYLVWGLIVSLGINSGMLGPFEKALADWFVKRRGLAMGISRFALGLGGALVPFLMTYLIIIYGWRTSFMIAGVFSLIIGLPLVWFFIKSRRPEYYGLMPDGKVISPKNSNNEEQMLTSGQEYAATFGEQELTAREALKTKAFWIICIYNMLMSLSVSAVNVHQIPHLIDLGFNPIAAAGAFGFTIFMSVPARIPAGFLSDRFKANSLKYIWIVSVAFVGVGILFLTLATNIWMIYLSAIFYGLGLGLRTGSRGPLMARYFGRKGFASIRGLSAIISLPISFSAPIYIGWIYDVTNSYSIAFSQTLILVLAALICLLFLDPPKQMKKKATDIEDFF
jgi:MFS family permease